MVNPNNLRNLWIIYRKELKDSLRDKRTLKMSFMMPMYFVAMFVVGVVFAVSKNVDKKVAGVTSIPVAVEGAQYLPEFVDWLREQGGNIKLIEKNAYQQVKDKKIDFALIISAEAAQKRANGEPIPVWLVYDASNQDSSSAVGFVRSQFYAWNARAGALRLIARGIASDAASPAWLRENNIADERKMSIYVLGILPMTLLLAAFIGSVGFSADMMAGERERRSLESLLITPVSAFAVYTGKWLTSLTLTLALLSVQLVMLAIAFRFLPFNQLGLRVDVNIIDFINLFWVLASVTVFAVALQLSVATFAKSFKDAQTLNGLMVFVPMVPIMYTLLNPGVFHGWWLWVPVLGQASIIKEILLGGAIANFTFVKFWIIAFALLVPAFMLGIWQLRRPTIIYGT